MKAYAIQRPDGSVIVDTQGWRARREHVAWAFAELTEGRPVQSLISDGYRLVEVEITVVTG